eukprot:8623174-Alexandrium_andersonii.AAC.1
MLVLAAPSLCHCGSAHSNPRAGERRASSRAKVRTPSCEPQLSSMPRVPVISPTPRERTGEFASPIHGTHPAGS